MTEVRDPIAWDLAERVAVRVSGREPFAQSYHYASLQPDFDELTAEAEALVAAETGLRSLAGPARARVTDRAGWVRANVASFRRLLKPVTERLGPRLNASPVAPVGRTVTGVQLGTMLGWMSTRVLGQYDLLLIEDENPTTAGRGAGESRGPHAPEEPGLGSPGGSERSEPGGRGDWVYYVGPNVLALEKRFAFPPREFRLWLALHEVTHRAQFTGIPWMAAHFRSLVDAALAEIDPDPKRLLAALRRAADQLRTGRNPLDDGGLAALLASPAQHEVLMRVQGLMSLLEGHGDVTMDRAGADRIPSADRFARVLRQRRGQISPPMRVLMKLIGLEAKMRQYEQGERFIARVEAEGGPALLARAWEGPDRLPTLPEIRDPDAWLRRLATLPRPTETSVAG